MEILYGKEMLEDMITIREASITDLQALLDLYSVLYGETSVEDNPGIRSLWNRIMTDQFYHIIVAEVDGKIVSSCTCVIVQNLTYEQRPYAYIENIVTESGYRAQGFATACLEEAKRIAQKDNCFKITINTSSKLKSTLKLYENLGYNCDELTAFVQWL